MAYTRDQVDEFIAFLLSDQDACSRVRAAILGDEFLSLPAEVANLTRVVTAFAEKTDKRFEEVEARLDAMDRHFEQIDRRLDQIDQRLDQIDGRLTNLEASHRRLEGRVGNLDGRSWESAYIAAIPGHLGTRYRRTKVLDKSAIEPIEDALERGVISSTEFADFLLADAVVSARPIGRPETIFLVIEISQVVDRGDVERAARRAAILRRTLPDTEIVAAVDGESATQGARGLAEELGVLELRDLPLGTADSAA